MTEALAKGDDVIIERRFVRTGARSVHYRRAGSGPAVVMLHDSPRSSRLHIDTMKVLGRRFQVFALDTPGYGNSDSLGIDDPTIADFADALDEALAALGLEGAPLYATHTSAKIALEYAARRGAPGLVLLDGLSIPDAPANEAFISAYMRPFRLDAGGAYLASEWSRIRDMLRWFPWFRPAIGARMPLATPPPEWIEQYAIDLFSAGAQYADAYTAAMHYDPLPMLRRIGHSTIVAARADDVLYKFLDHVPAEANECLSVVRLPADRGAWLHWLESAFDQANPVSLNTMSQPVIAACGPVYVDLPHGQMLVHRAGKRSDKPPLLILDAPTQHHGAQWGFEMSRDRVCLLPELPGFGESDPFTTPTAELYADAIIAMLDALGCDQLDMIAIGYVTPLAMFFAARHPDRVGRLVLDGAIEFEQGDAAELCCRLCPEFPFDRSGAHLQHIWQMLRDGEASWPWFVDSVDAHRAIEPNFSAADLHRSLLGILKQPGRYGDAVIAAVDAAVAGLPGPIEAPILLFDAPADPGYRSAVAIQARCPRSTLVPRPPDLPSAAEAARTFLDGTSSLAVPFGPTDAETGAR